MAARYSSRVTEMAGATPEPSGRSSTSGTGWPIGSPAARPISITVGTPLARTIIAPWCWIVAASPHRMGLADRRSAPASRREPTVATQDWVSSLSGK